ncbi:MAG: hypothetical protein LiPW16_78 [Microgenomates group bacterium LiPW_16]|nr:MAG: hypothetical protein LiPW16_78 [Microgenomates group bacterium LiPW_16]
MEEVKPQKTNWWKIGFLVLFALLIIGANIFAWYFFFKGKEQTLTPSPTPQPIETVIPILSSPTPKIDDESLIKEAIFKLTGLDATKAEVTINGVYAGQATPKCSEIAPYNFPKDMVPECLDAANKLIKR